MKTMITLFLIAFNLFLTAGNNPALEKAKADFKKVNLTYSSTPVFSMNMSYSVFDNHIGGNMVEQKKGQYIKSKELSYTKILNIETIVNAKTTVIVNNDDRMLVITDSKKIELSPIQTNMDTLLKMCSNVKVKDLGTSERCYSLDFGNNENSEFSKIEVYINLTNYSIKKLVMFYNESMPLNQNDYYADEKKPRLEIEYNTFKTTASVNESVFAESTYLSLVNNNYKGKGKYATYQVINQLQSARFKKK